MDTIFTLGQESRQRILHRAAACLPGCAYLCAWAPVAPHQAPPPPPPHHNLLYCLDAWLSIGAVDGGVRQQLFDAYRGSICASVTGCVPGSAYGAGAGEYMELSEIDLAASASLPVQQRFYQEAGIKMAAFMGCESGEIEVGFSTASAAAYGGGSSSLQASMEQVFSEDFFQQSLLEELLQLPPTRPSSSSSSPLPSVSVGSPPADGAASTPPLLRVIPPSPRPRELAMQATTPTLHPRHVSPFASHAAGVGVGGGFLQFPSADADDAAMAQAMLHVISSSSSSTSSTNHRAIRSPRRGTAAATAFRPYTAALAPRAAMRRPAGGQRMIKMGISILRRMHMVRCSQERAAAAAVARRGNEEEDATAAVAASSQLHHMISERRRRERLNESFEQLRCLLPPGSKKDKATVLAKTLEYMNLLIAQISELESKNRSLQTQFHQRANGPISTMIRTVNEVHHNHHHQWPVTGGSPERVQVQVIGGASTSTSASPEFGSSSSREVTVRVAVRAVDQGGAADVSELVLRVLALIKEMGGFTVVSVDARQPGGGGNGVAQASLTLRVTAGEFDEASLKEAVTKAIQSLVTPPPP